MLPGRELGIACLAMIISRYNKKNDTLNRARGGGVSRVVVCDLVSPHDCSPRSRGLLIEFITNKVRAPGVGFSDV